MKVGYTYTRFFTALLILALLAPACTAVHGTASNDARIVTVQIPAPEAKAKLALGLIVMPRFTAPVFTVAGGSFELVLAKKEVNVEKVIIDDGYGHKYVLNVEKLGPTRYRVSIPSNAVQGVYDLIIDTGKWCGE